MDHILLEIDGTFYRAIDPAFREHVFSGSRGAGRYSRPDQPTLYLSSSREGVEAAMIAHKHGRQRKYEIIKVKVKASSIFDLRDEVARNRAGIALNDATAPWQDIAAEGLEPSSWRVRDRLESLGAAGLIDPSRKALGLWHLVLFSWDSKSVQIG